jgi:hypothetical protein
MFLFQTIFYVPYGVPRFCYSLSELHSLPQDLHQALDQQAYPGSSRNLNLLFSFYFRELIKVLSSVGCFHSNPRPRHTSSFKPANNNECHHLIPTSTADLFLRIRISVSSSKESESHHYVKPQTSNVPPTRRPHPPTPLVSRPLGDRSPRASAHR